MMDDAEQRLADEQRGEKRNLVDIINNDVVVLPAETPEIGRKKLEIEKIPAALTYHPDPVKAFFRRRPGVGRAEERYLVTGPGYPRKNIMEVDLRPAGERIGPILPVQ